MSFQLMLPAPVDGQQASHVSIGGAAELQLSQEQSLCLVKIFLNASLGCICFARGLIPSDSPSYQDRRVDDLVLIPLTSSPASYHNFLSFQGQLSVNSESQPFKILVRGKDKRTDHILNLMENGVFEAVDRGYLEAVQFSLSCDSSRRQEVIEYYTFSFTYAKCENSRRQVCSVEISSAPADRFYVAGAQKSFRKAIRNLLVLCQQLPTLPSRRSLGVNLLYNHTCPVLYEPSGFAGWPDTDTDAFSFINTSTVADDVGKFHAGHYQISVAAGHAKPVGKEAADLSQVAETIIDGDSTRNLTSSHLEDLRTKRQLQAMQRSSSVPSNLISTQMECALKGTQIACQNVPQSAISAALPPKSGSGTGVDWSSNRQQNVTPTKMAELIVQAWALEAHDQSTAHVLDMDCLQKSNKIKRLNPGKKVNCECGSNHEGDGTTLCELCGLWQHDICYGLQRYPAQKRPHEHFCYSCLLLPRGEHVNDEMPAMVRIRLALTYFFDNDYDVQVIEKDLLMKAVHLAAKDHAAYLDLVTELERQGFIRKSSSNGTLVVVREQESVTDARSKYLDPLARILDYYDAVKDKETAHDRAKAVQEALDRYSVGRSFNPGEIESELDEWVCKNAFGGPVVRWGFYPERSEVSRQLEYRKRAASPVASPGVKKARTGRKMSVSKTTINLDLHSEASSDIETDDFSTTDNASTA